MSRRNFGSELFGPRPFEPIRGRTRALRRFRNSDDAARRRRWLMVEPLEDRLCLNGTWASEAPMPTPRFGLDVAADPASGLIYALGGQVGVCPDATTSEVYNPATNSWAIKASMPSPHDQGGAAVVNGIVYAIGGQNGCGFGNVLDTVDAYNPATDTWAAMAHLPEPAGSFGVGVV